MDSSSSGLKLPEILKTATAAAKEQGNGAPIQLSNLVTTNKLLAAIVPKVSVKDITKAC